MGLNYFHVPKMRFDCRTRDDVAKLPVEKVKIYPSGIIDENAREEKIIIRDIPSRDKIGNIVGDAIIKKGEKLSNYKRKAEDNYENFIKSKNGLFQGVFNRHLIRAIIDSGFEEIFFLTRINKEIVYYELKSTCFVFFS